MAELDCIAISGIELAHDTGQPRWRVAIAGGKLKQKTTELFAENLFQAAKFFHEHSGADEPLLVSDKPIHFHRVAEIRWRVPEPAFHGAHFRPAVERRVQLDRVEGRGVMPEPGVRPF